MPWLKPWEPLDPHGSVSEALTHRLALEVAVGHALDGKPVTALARRVDRDDVLYALQDGTLRVAVVHLSWISLPPDKPPFPLTLWFDSFEDWAAKGMQEDHLEYVEE